SHSLVIFRAGWLAIDFVSVQAVILLNTLLKIGTIFGWERGVKPDCRGLMAIAERMFGETIFPTKADQFIGINGHTVNFDIVDMSFARFQIFKRPVFAMNRNNEHIFRRISVRFSKPQAGI